ncbi:MAG: lipocalin-like domain-containing protein [Gammaproteobacteria bacterium]|nr:lipocalin-like domain-containing protein [Gammaproteobacteria bacterium]
MPWAEILPGSLRWLLMALLLAVPAPMMAAAPESPQRSAAGRPGLDLEGILGGAATAGFARALEPRPFRFPADHGPHPDFRSEWWYFTAHLRDDRDRPLGVQFTLFRQALAPPGPVPENASAWRTRSVWMAHVALVDPQQGHRAAERFARGAPGPVGVRAHPFRARLDDWTLVSDGPDGLFPMRLTLDVPELERPFALDLTLETDRAPVPQGDDGLSRKSDRPGNASYYYSFTRIQVRGTIRTAGRSLPVSGLGWLDREWSTSVLDPSQQGWDWLALHLEDGRDLMIYRIRRRDGTIDPVSSGVLVDAEGGHRRLAPDDWSLEPQRFWQDDSGGRWPVEWRLRIPEAGIDGRIRPVRDDQLNRLSVRYWEGMVCLDGSRPGCGYLELTGYGGEPPQS